MRRTLLVMALIAAGCGRDAAGPDASLTQTEVQAIAGTLVSSNAALAAWVPSGHSEPFTMQSHWDTPMPCAAGGTLTPDVQVNIAYTGEPFTASLDASGTATAADCGMPADGQTLTVAGTFNISGHASMSSSQPAGSQAFSVKGAVDWRRTDGTHGSCTFDLSTSGMFMGPEIKGKVCGRSVDLSSQQLRG